MQPKGQEQFVFPTDVGMNRFEDWANNFGYGVPHRRGDEPMEEIQSLMHQDVFPTDVGMNRYGNVNDR